MNIFKSKKQANPPAAKQSALAETVLKVIHDGVVMVGRDGAIQFINSAAATMCGYNSPTQATGLKYDTVIRIESSEGRTFSEEENPLFRAMKTSQPLKPFSCNLIVGASDKRIPVSLAALPPEGIGGSRIITFRDITDELAAEGERTEFISTASHEMRTPVASIEGYLSLALNPQTASIDERARNYLDAAHAASKHLGKLFQDLLDVTKLDDGRIRPHFVPADMNKLIGTIIRDYLEPARKAKLEFTYGPDKAQAPDATRRLEQTVYSYVDKDFMREIMGNLIENAIKYTPSGGSIYVNVRGDGDQVLINVTDTGMGISSDDLAHIFQKFYRADNSDTRTIGGTGLGLYLVKQRVEAMGGRVWAESAFGEGSTFYVSLPRLTHAEFEKRMIAVQNQNMRPPLKQPASAPQSAQPVQPAQSMSPQPVQPAQPAPPAPTTPNPPAPPSPVLQPQPQPQPQLQTQPAQPPINNNNINGEIR